MQQPIRVESPTERRNPGTLDIDQLPALEVLRLLNTEDQLVPGAVAAVLPDLARVVDEAVTRLGAGARMHYFGAGSSGRIAVMDAAELIPTFGLEPGVVIAHHAGGEQALTRPVEGIEDLADSGAKDAASVSGDDIVVGLSASGRTPYVAGALRAARDAGAFTVLVSANPDAVLARDVDVHVGLDTGPEAIAGSTRLKAASGQKLVLNSLSTAAMIGLGRTYSNLMVDMASTNGKLRGRLITILESATGQDDIKCAAALTAAGGELKTALVSMLTGCEPAIARMMLDSASGRVRPAVAAALL